jgi:signal transduction histidine kinase
VAEGDLAVRVPVVSGDELGELAASFNAMVGRLQRHDEELRESRTRIVTAADGARRQVERDLHDGAQQQLVLVQLKLGPLRKRVEADPEAAALATELREDLAAALTSLRDLAHGIYPAVLEAEGLPGAIAEAAQRAPIPTTVDVDGVGRLPADLEVAIYFCCLEALQNAGKHAGPGATATVTLATGTTGLEFAVADDGRGYDTAATAANAGVQNMADRIGALGGTLRIASAPGHGTTVRGDVPLSG